MSWKAHVDGTHGGEENFLYKKKSRAIIIHAIGLSFSYGMLRLTYPGCLAGFLSTRVFLVRNPYLILKEGEGLSSISSLWNLAKATSFSTAFSYWAENVVLLGAAIEELIESFFGLFFSGELVFSLEE